MQLSWGVHLETSSWVLCSCPKCHEFYSNGLYLHLTQTFIWNRHNYKFYQVFVSTVQQSIVSISALIKPSYSLKRKTRSLVSVRNDGLWVREVWYQWVNVKEENYYLFSMGHRVDCAGLRWTTPGGIVDIWLRRILQLQGLGEGHSRDNNHGPGNDE